MSVRSEARRLRDGSKTRRHGALGHVELSRSLAALMVLALVMASCGGDKSSPTAATSPQSPAAPTSTDGRVSPAAENCERLAEVELADVIAISSELVASGFVAGQVSLPQFCRVALTVDPAINIEVWLPTDHYNDRFQGIGGGGYAGEINFDGMAEALLSGYATASTDTGHVGTGLDGSFALTDDGALDMPLIEDFVFRSLIELTDKSRSLIAEFYGEAADFAYWNGCSSGGREGLMLAQRHPDAYDGILAGAPAINWDRFIPSLLWPQIVMDQEFGGPIDGCKLAEATAAAVQACDALDGVNDGVLEHPSTCDFDPVSLVGVETPCGEFTETDAAVIQAIWDGPRTLAGEFMWYGLAPGAPLHEVAGPLPFPIGSASAYLKGGDWSDGTDAISLSANPRANGMDCSEEADESIASSAEALAGWIRAHPGLEVSDGPAISVDGRQTFVLDVMASEEFADGCVDPEADISFVPLFTHPGYSWGIGTKDRQRLILIEIGMDTAMLIGIDTLDPADIDAFVDDVQPILDSIGLTAA